MTDTLWTAEDLARYLHKAPATVRRLISQDPTRLPPRVQGLRPHVWVPEVARQWVVDQSRPPPRQTGRRRSVT